MELPLWSILRFLFLIASIAALIKLHLIGSYTKLIQVEYVASIKWDQFIQGTLSTVFLQAMSSSFEIFAMHFVIQL